MKKIGIIIFAAAFTIGLISALNCSIGNVGGYLEFDGTRGSGNSKSEVRSLSGFDRVTAGSAVRVEIIAGQEFSVEVEADDNLLEHIKTEIHDGRLEISTDGRLKTRNEMNIRISMPEINALELGGASVGKVSNIKTDVLELQANGASKLTIDGEAKTLSLEANGASKIDAENLKTETVTAEASGASKVIVSPATSLTAEASGASIIYYSGDPQTVVRNTSGASSIKQK